MVLKHGRRALALAGAVAAGVAGCGPGLAPGTGGEQPMFTFNGVLASGDGIPATAHPRLGVIWTDPLQRQSDVPMPADWLSSTLAPDTFDGFNTMLYRPPPPAALFRIDAPSGGDSIEMAFGEAIIYNDAGGNGAFRIDGPHATMREPDGYLAGSPDVIVYVARPFSNAQNGFPLGEAILPGYTTLTFFCNGQLPGDIKQNVGLSFVLQPSQALPEIRSCLRSHSP